MGGRGKTEERGLMAFSPFYRDSAEIVRDFLSLCAFFTFFHLSSLQVCAGCSCPAELGQGEVHATCTLR